MASTNYDGPAADPMQFSIQTEAALNRALSNQTLDTSNETESDLANTVGTPRKRPSPNRNSAAYVRNYRLSRYRNAMNATIPFRRTPITGTEELPVDSIGCFSTCSSSWVRHYYVAAPKKPKKSKKKPASDPPADSTSAAPQPTVVDEEPATQRTPPPLLPRVTAADSCEVNAKRLLGLYKYEEQTNGRINGSMLRVAWKFCRTRLLLACFLQTLSHLFAVLMLSVFLRIIMSTIDASWLIDYDAKIKEIEESEKNGTHVRYMRNTDENWKIWYCSAAMVGSFMAMCFLKSASNAVSLRTAMRLRTACIGAAFSKSLKSSVKNNVAPHQVVSLCSDESDLIAALVMKGPNLVSHTFGLIFCVVAAVAALGAPGMWPIFGIIGILLLGAIVAIISAIFYRRSQSFLSKKLSVLEEYYNSYNTVASDFLNLHESFKTRFSAALSAQYLALSKSELFRPSSSGGITLVVLLGGTYLVWCDLQFETESTPMTNLTIMYSLLVPTLIAEICEAFQAITQGVGVLSKVKNAIILSSPELPKMRPTRDLKVSISDATFRWDGAHTVIPMSASQSNNNEMTTVDDKLFTLQIDGLTIPKNQMIGITGEPGSGKTTLIYALLGHLNLRMGEFYQKDKCSYYPELPYTMDGGSIKENIVFYDDWEERRYQNALTLVQLHFNAGFDETPIEHVLDLQMLQKISLARALYSDRDTVILEEPLSALDVESDLSEIFEVVTDKLRESGKTVIVVSENENILKHCQRIFLLTHGKTSGFVEYADAQQIPAVQQVLQNYRLRKNAAREHLQTTNANLNNAHNISTEDLVIVDEEPTLRMPIPVSICQTALLLCLTLINALIVVLLPFAIALYLTNQIHPSPWGVMAVFFLIPVIFITNLLVKHFVNKIGRRYNKNVQRDLFQKLLNSSLADQQDTHLSQILNTMMDNNLLAFQVRSTTLYLWSIIFFAFVLSVMANGFVFFIVLVPIIDFMLRFYGYWRTIGHFGHLETETRQKLLHLVSNQLKGRAVIQSFDGVQKFRSKIYKAIEENTASVFIGRSVNHYNQLMFMLWQAVTLTLLLILLTLHPYIQDIHFVFEVYVFMMVISHMVQMLDWRFTRIVADQKLSTAHHYLQTSTLPDHSTLKYEV